MKDFNELVFPAELRFDQDHEWVSTAAPYRVGVSDFAQDQLGDLTFVELPEVGASFAKSDEFGTLESIKSVSSVYCPVEGTIKAINPKLADDPGLVNRDPYGEGWLIEIEPADATELNGLMSSAEYAKFLQDNAS